MEETLTLSCQRLFYFSEQRFDFHWLSFWFKVFGWSSKKNYLLDREFNFKKKLMLLFKSEWLVVSEDFFWSQAAKYWDLESGKVLIGSDGIKMTFKNRNQTNESLKSFSRLRFLQIKGFKSSIFEISSLRRSWNAFESSSQPLSWCQARISWISMW